MESPNFMKDLFNVLKNDTRLSILQKIAKGRYSLSRLQQELKKAGYLHSQDTLAEEYLGPLLEVGLATESQDHFSITAFGDKLNKLIENIPEFTTFFPSRSECYEEDVLKALLAGPKSFDAISELIPSTILSRILKRLRTMDLIETPEERDYMFFFKSKRDSTKEILKATETRVYRSIPEEGISVRRLSQKTDLSLRRIYKYLRGLKGKKLVFARKIPKTYSLTEKGERIAWLVNEMNKLVKETLNFSEIFTKRKENS